MHNIKTQIFVEKAKSIHGDIYDYSLTFYINAKVKVKIVCPVHGVFEQTPNNHLKGQGCKICRTKQKADKQRMSLDTFINKSNKVHNDKYDYSLVEYQNSGTKVKIVCPIHGEFMQSPYLHLKGHGCTKCKGVAISKSKTKNSDTFIKEATTIHNDKYDYSLVEYQNTHSHIKIVCPVHGVFEQTPNNHLRPNGCPKCANCGISKKEQEIQDWVSSFVDIVRNDRNIISPFELDVVIPSHKLAIEFNGLYWHSERQGKNRSYHLNKYKLCRDKGYRLIQIWENEWIMRQDIVKSIILSSLGIYTKKIGARQCKVVNVVPQTARQFYNDNHIQGFKGGTHKGLYYKDKLVSLMTISRGILERFASRLNYQIHGAFSKLLTSFDIKALTTFCDIRYFTGNVYEKNGFIYQYLSKPNYFYFKQRSNELHSRISFQKHKLEDKLELFNPNLTEYQNMTTNGYDRIWDCGNMKFIKG